MNIHGLKLKKQRISRKWREAKNKHRRWEMKSLETYRAILNHKIELIRRERIKAGKKR